MPKVFCTLFHTFPCHLGLNFGLHFYWVQLLNRSGHTQGFSLGNNSNVCPLYHIIVSLDKTLNNCKSPLSMPLTLVVHCDYITYLYRPRVLPWSDGTRVGQLYLYLCLHRFQKCAYLTLKYLYLLVYLLSPSSSSTISCGTVLILLPKIKCDGVRTSSPASSYL